MITMEYGVNCAKCGSFISINCYEFDPPLKNAPSFMPARGAHEQVCPYCGLGCVYSSDADVVHRVADKGAAAKLEKY